MRILSSTNSFTPKISPVRQRPEIECRVSDVNGALTYHPDWLACRLRRPRRSTVFVEWLFVVHYRRVLRPLDTDWLCVGSWKSLLPLSVRRDHSFQQLRASKRWLNRDNRGEDQYLLVARYLADTIARSSRDCARILERSDESVDWSQSTILVQGIHLRPGEIVLVRCRRWFPTRNLALDRIDRETGSVVLQCIGQVCQCRETEQCIRERQVYLLWFLIGLFKPTIGLIECLLL